MEQLLKRYEEVIDRLFNADKWLNDKGINGWEKIRGKKAYNEYFNLIKEAEQLQKDLHKHRKARA